ncbi:hypothetical protein F0225_15880 [Vibrio pectenicida]|uniref:Uncharacterized protein n=1 Tax=Vibrio pectenicida TaxID=62763 RepID=A0A7Y4A1M3_9VIBR|nr:hypothetical protein [Vibrio pectenicida]NOH72811.1 hypothetical protein [Vibrio pectenicida]
MTKSLCKLSRKQIADGLGDIHRLVAEPKFVCRSCARSSAERGSLCKPAAIPPLSCQNQLSERQSKLSEALLINKHLSPQVEDKSLVVRRVVEQVKQKAQKKTSIAPNELHESFANHKEIKNAKKALKKQYKQQKKLLKLAKKTLKLQKREAKLRAGLDLGKLISTGKASVEVSKVH